MVGCVLLLRPTQSKGLYIQQVGRGLRPSPKATPKGGSEGSGGEGGEGSKTCCVVIDMVGNTARHGPITGPVTYRWERSSWSYNSKQGGTKAAGENTGGGRSGGGGGSGGGESGLAVRQANSGGAEDVHERAVRRQKNASKKASRLFRCRYTSCGALLHGGLSTCPACHRATGNGKGPKLVRTDPTDPMDSTDSTTKRKPGITGGHSAGEAKTKTKTTAMAMAKPAKTKNAAATGTAGSSSQSAMVMKIPLKAKSKPRKNAALQLPLSPLPR